MNMPATYPDSVLEAFLDESLPAEEMAALEAAVRRDPILVSRLTAINQRRSAGIHTVGAIWRQHQLTCVSREKLGSLLLGALDRNEAEYIEFHIHTVGCRWCAANLADLEQQQREASQAQHTRRRRYFESSAGYLRNKR